MHRWSLVSSAILVCMVAGFLGSSTWSRMDLIAKVALDVIAAALLLLLRKRILSRGTMSWLRVSVAWLRSATYQWN